LKKRGGRNTDPNPKTIGKKGQHLTKGKRRGKKSVKEQALSQS